MSLKAVQTFSLITRKICPVRGRETEERCILMWFQKAFIRGLAVGVRNDTA
jgi:hypothetical protein